ncbi:MAG: LigA protein, partial [Actinobacteria bacterium]|nr:LigA protein [Actinomycetota bacterium]
PNTTLTVAGLATVILNEQITSSSGGTNSITVNAVHILLNLGLATGDIIISQSHCDATAGTVVPVGTIGVLGLTGLAGIGFAFMQHRGYRRRLAAAASRSAL